MAKHQLNKWPISNFANGQISDEWSCEDFTWATLLFSVRPLLPVEEDNAAREWLRAWTSKGFKIVSKQEKESVYHSLSQSLSVWLLVMRMVVGVDQSVQNKIIFSLLCLEVSQVP